jgi:hypothetical protein
VTSASLHQQTSTSSRSTKNISATGRNSTQAGFSKFGGKQESLKRHHDADQYNPIYFDRDKVIVFPGTFTDSRQAAWIELMLTKFAFFLGIGVNKARNSPRNMVTLAGGDYSESNLGSIYLVPVHTHITT